MTIPDVGWLSVRCVYRWKRRRKGRCVYQERVTIWQAASFESAIAMAEEEALAYAHALPGRYLGIAQAYDLFDAPAHGTRRRT